jgi:formate hydrogenlyase subunit 6/NADH:ubiquinone oxidoreductase subunit I
MASNDVKDVHYRTPAESEIMRLEAMGIVIRKRERRREKDTGYLIEVNPWPERLVVSLMDLSGHVGGVNNYCCDSECTGCGICEKVCLSQKIKMNGDKPVWQKGVLCYMCYACVNDCPRHSIQINDIPYVKSYTRQNGRYSHPYATANEMALQKEKQA